MVGFGHSFWIDSLRACKFFNWDPALRLRENLPYRSKPSVVDFPSIRWAPQLEHSSALRVLWEAGWLTRTLHLFGQLLCVRKRGQLQQYVLLPVRHPHQPGKTNKEIGSADNSGGVVTCSMNKGLSQGSMSCNFRIHCKGGCWSRWPEQAPRMLTPLAFQQ